MLSILEIFQEIAPFYDRMNDLMSGGLHHFWKAYFVQALPWKSFPSPFQWADVACGSGDIIHFMLQDSRSHELGYIYAIDPSANMLDLARERFDDARLLWHEACGEALPLENNSVDLYTIAFGLRNAHIRTAVLQEAHRVLRSGGWFYCLEFSHPTNPGLEFFYHQYLRLLPFLGHWAVGNKEAYHYLAQSIKDFPTPLILSMEMQEVGLYNITHEALSEGIVAIHKGQKA